VSFSFVYGYNRDMNLKKISSIGLSLGMVIATIYDQAISQVLYDAQSSFGLFFYHYGQSLGLFSGVLALSILIHQKPLHFKTLGIRLLYQSLLIILGLGIGVQTHYFTQMDLGLCIFFSLFITWMLYYFISKLSQSTLDHLKPYALMGLFTLIVVLTVPSLLKLLWGRPRYRLVVLGQANFVAWFKPLGQGLIDDYKSFPSGHSAVSAAALWLVMIPSCLYHSKPFAIWIKGSVVLWVLMVMGSRIILGDHYLSDVLIGLAIPLACLWILKRRIKTII